MSPVSTSIDGKVVTILLDDGKANALSLDIIEGLRAALRQAVDDNRAVAIIGREGKFSAGFDLSVMTSSPEASGQLVIAGAELGIEICESPVPVVLGITGHALAMGAVLTTCADHRVGAAGPYKIGLNEVAIGLPVPHFAVETARHRLSAAWFTRCVQHAHICDPEGAVEAGFLDELVPLDQVAGRATEVAAQLAELPRGAFAVTRRVMRGELVASLREGLTTDTTLRDMRPAPAQ